MRIAALTMAYNEPVWAPVWARYYASQVGTENCFLLDHGSDDGSTDGLGIRVERLERSALDEVWRAAAISTRVAELLRSYDAVVHSDVDELVVADPAWHAGLAGFVGDCGEPVVTAVGLDLQHIVGSEPALDPGLPIGQQRQWVRFSAAMCKPALVRRRVTWAPGFHRADSPTVFGGLYLIHLRYADLAFGLRRLARSRELAFACSSTNLHQRVPDEDFEGMMRVIASLPTEPFSLDWRRAPIRGWLERVCAADAGWLSIAGDRLWRLPERVRLLF